MIGVLLGISICANIVLVFFSYIIFVRKMSYKAAFQKNVGRCKKILENERKYKELSKGITDIFVKLKANAKEQAQLVEQANQIIVQEEDITQEMIEISGNFKTSF